MKTRIAVPALMIALLAALSVLPRTADACGCYFSDKDLKEMAAKLIAADSTEEVRLNAARMVAMANEYTFTDDGLPGKVLDALVAAAKGDASIKVRAAAIRGLCAGPESRHAGFIDLLIGFMGESDLDIRKSAAIAVGQFGFKANNAAAALRKLQADLPSDDDWAESIAWSLKSVTTEPPVESTEG